MVGRLSNVGSGWFFVAVVAVAAHEACAAPILSVRPDGLGYMFQVTPSPDLLTDGSSVLRVELAAEEALGRITAASVYSPVWPTGYSAYNPFVDANTTALWNGSATQAFASFQSVTVSTAAPLDYLRLRILPGATGQRLAYSATIIQDGVRFEGIVGSFGTAIDFAADFNNTGTVDLLDLDILGANFGSSSATQASGDTNNDGRVDLLDLDVLGGEFGAGPVGATSQAVAVPEPASVAVAAIAALVGCITARRVSRTL